MASYPLIKLPSSKVDVKIIALDLDDTLLNHDLVITPYTVEMLQKAAQKGIYIVPCSGRAENGILPFVRQLNIAGTQFGRYIIAMNGAVIFDLHERKVIYNRTVEGDILLYAYNEAKKMGLACQTYDASTIYPSVDNEWTRLDADLCKLKICVRDDFEEFLAKGQIKLVIPGEPEKVSVLQEILKKNLGDKAVVFTSKPFFLEVMPANCGKGEAIMILAEKLGIDKNQTMGFGDSMNDESMIKMVHHSVAMCNGLPYIQDIASYVTRKDNEHDGIGDFIAEYVL
ncbi:MAG: Cof-type HAD-IIB family hydrolase [Treponema sp.]|nr:Cof-type HAD-IIB family hydrolase [Treponema sp.]